MTKEERRAKKLELRAEVKADYNKRFPRLTGKRLARMVKVKADMQMAEFVNALKTVENFVQTEATA
jgi:hypothetical protein